MLLLSISSFFIFFSLYLQDILGQIFSLYIMTIAAAETSIALALLIVYYRLVGHISLDQLPNLKG
jgi:NADH-quinone oxidoreductase subunit K